MGGLPRPPMLFQSYTLILTSELFRCMFMKGKFMSPNLQINTLTSLISTIGLKPLSKYWVGDETNVAAWLGIFEFDDEKFWFPPFTLGDPKVALVRRCLGSLIGKEPIIPDIRNLIAEFNLDGPVPRTIWYGDGDYQNPKNRRAALWDFAEDFYNLCKRSNRVIIAIVHDKTLVFLNDSKYDREFIFTQKDRDEIHERIAKRINGEHLDNTIRCESVEALYSTKHLDTSV